MRLRSRSTRIRLARGSPGSLLLVLVISADWASRVNGICAADPADHPYIEAQDLKTATCLTCHPTKAQSEFVHAAVEKCENCHQAVSSGGHTTIVSPVEGADLCARCHEIDARPRLHGPYREGQCSLCHSPHGSAYQAETRAAVNTLCLGCHMSNQPQARVDLEHKRVYLLDGLTYGLSAWESAPKIGSKHPANNPSDGATDQISGTGAAKRSAGTNCITCHDPHGSKAEHLLRSRAAGREGHSVLGRYCGAFGPSHQELRSVTELRDAEPRGQS